MAANDQSSNWRVVSPAGWDPGNPPADAMHLRGAALATAVTKRDDKLLVRLYNPTDAATEARVSLPGLTITEAWSANLGGDPIGPASVSGGAAFLRVPAHAVSTLALAVRPGK